MKIEVDDEKFFKFAKDLKTTPEELMLALVKHTPDMAIQARNEVINGRPLDVQLEDLFENALPGMVLNDLIRDIVGEHEYVIDDGGYSREDGIIWLQVSFFEGTVLNMGSITLQFGKDPGMVALEFVDSFETDEDLAGIANEIEDELDTTDPTFDLDHFDSVEFDDNGESIAITMQINWKEEFDLPRIAEIDEIMRKIKKSLLSHKKNN